MKTFVILIGLCGCLSVLPAQTIFQPAPDAASDKEQNPPVSFNGYVRGSVFGGGEAYNPASTFAELALQAHMKKGKAFLLSDIRFRKGIFFGENDKQLQLKELYAGYRSEKLDLLLGNQIVSWGRTDGFNPTNNITPNDYFFLSANPDDQKESNFMIRLKYRFVPAVELDLIGIPFYQASNYRYDLFPLGDNVRFGDETLPRRALKNGSVAARLNVDLPAVGWSLSYFRGYDPYHGFDVQKIDWSSGSPIITNSSTPYLKSTLGADVAFPVKDWMVRAELACNLTENADDKMFIPKPDWAYVAGLERSWFGITVIGQYIGKYTPDFTALVMTALSDPQNPEAQMQYATQMIDYSNRLFNRRIFYQQKKTNHAASLSVSKSFGYEAWNAEFAAYYNFTSDEWMLRPKVSWKIDDALSVCLGGNYMQGSSETLFDYSSAIMNGVFVEVKVSF